MAFGSSKDVHVSRGLSTAEASIAEARRAVAQAKAGKCGIAVAGLMDAAEWRGKSDAHMASAGKQVLSDGGELYDAYLAVRNVCLREGALGGARRRRR